jgi:hypothetical protein
VEDAQLWVCLSYLTDVHIQFDGMVVLVGFNGSYDKNLTVKTLYREEYMTSLMHIFSTNKVPRVVL